MKCVLYTGNRKHLVSVKSLITVAQHQTAESTLHKQNRAVRGPVLPPLTVLESGHSSPISVSGQSRAKGIKRSKVRKNYLDANSVVFEHGGCCIKEKNKEKTIAQEHSLNVVDSFPGRCNS